jgi:predicted NUDIX family phosphoesterase
MSAPPQHEEIVLCSKTSDLPESWLPEAGALPLREEELIDTLGRTAPHWIRRSLAEADPGFLQWIPYALLLRPDGRLAAYPRRGTEARLHGRWSMGIGGHVNRQDTPPAGAVEQPSEIWRTTLRNGLLRELTEEFPGAVGGSSAFLGLVYEGRTPVGRVHMGAVYLHRLEEPPGEPGAELAGLRWVTPGESADPSWRIDRLELWSSLALDLLARVPGPVSRPPP